MSGSLKIGVVAGLIAGFVTAIEAIFVSIPILLGLGPGYYGVVPIPATLQIAANEIVNNLIWGAIFGAIYSRTYKVIPGKGILKGLVLGLFGYLVFNIYFATIFLPFLFLEAVAGLVIRGILDWITYGLVLGILFEFLRVRYHLFEKEPEIIQYDMKSGIMPGAIAGIIGGLGTFFTIFASVYTGLWPFFPRHLIDIGFIISLVGTQIMIHLIPGIYLGAIYPKVYNLVPGKGVLKGLCYGLTATFLFNEVRAAAWNLGYGVFSSAITMLITGIVVGAVYGLVLGALYRR